MTRKKPGHWASLYPAALLKDGPNVLISHVSSPRAALMAVHVKSVHLESVQDRRDRHRSCPRTVVSDSAIQQAVGAVAPDRESTHPDAEPMPGADVTTFAASSRNTIGVCCADRIDHHVQGCPRQISIGFRKSFDRCLLAEQAARKAVGPSTQHRGSAGARHDGTCATLRVSSCGSPLRARSLGSQVRSAARFGSSRGASSWPNWSPSRSPRRSCGDHAFPSRWPGPVADACAVRCCDWNLRCRPRRFSRAYFSSTIISDDKLTDQSVRYSAVLRG
jgi:hypothetical protein